MMAGSRLRYSIRQLARKRQLGPAQLDYGARPGTPAALLPKQIRESVKAERLARLQELLDAQATAFNRRTVGLRLPVLLERPGRHAGQLVGRTPWLQAVHLDAGQHGIGDLVDVDIQDAHSHSLAGSLAGHIREISA